MGGMFLESRRNSFLSVRALGISPLFMFWDSTVTFYMFFPIALYYSETPLIRQKKVAATDGAPVFWDRYHSGDKALGGRERERPPALFRR